jgi:predicted Rossmann fold flavoprotein
LGKSKTAVAGTAVAGTAVAVVGGGAAGMMAAGRAALHGADVTLFEKNGSLGKKLAITGKGRCNVTNNCPTDEFLLNVTVNHKFLYTALNTFSPQDTINFFESLNVPLKTERGKRVFPCSDKASDIVNALNKYVIGNGCKIIHENVEKLIIYDDKIKGLKTFRSEEQYMFDSVIICTGGKSYPGTGSTGDGYKFARQCGIEVTPLSPSLVPIETSWLDCETLAGLTLKNIKIEIINVTTEKTIYSDFGELLFTHFGLSGPVILSASSYIKDIKEGLYRISIDLKPALDEKVLDDRIVSDFQKYINKNLSNALDDLLPKSIIPIIIGKSGIDQYRKVNTITVAERKSLLNAVKKFTIDLKQFRPIDEAIITSGGISVKELHPKTMESRKIKGLFFAGEVIDVDAYTGGFNLQIAFSTAVLAADGACNG